MLIVSSIFAFIFRVSGEESNVSVSASLVETNPERARGRVALTQLQFVLLAGDNRVNRDGGITTSSNVGADARSASVSRPQCLTATMSPTVTVLTPPTRSLSCPFLTSLRKSPCAIDPSPRTSEGHNTAAAAVAAAVTAVVTAVGTAVTAAAVPAPETAETTAAEMTVTAVTAFFHQTNLKMFFADQVS